MLSLVHIVIAAAFAPLVAANAEKVIFLGPAAANIPTTKPTLSDLNLQRLTPGVPSIRTNLSRVFPNDAIAGQEKGESTWILLDELTEGQRYEFRVCWAATEPTDFSMEVYELSRVWETPDLMVSLANYAYAHLPEPDLQSGEPVPEKERSTPQERTASVLLLHVQAAADYFSHDASLMKDPPPVLVDLILDPYLYNVLPVSLLSTGGYIIIVAIVTWFIARWVTATLQTVADESHPSESKKKI